MSKWQTVFDLTDPGIKPQTSHTNSDTLNDRANRSNVARITKISVGIALLSHLVSIFYSSPHKHLR